MIANRGAKRPKAIHLFRVRCISCEHETVVAVGRHVLETVRVAGTSDDTRHGVYVYEVNGRCAACLLADSQRIVPSQQLELPNGDEMAQEAQKELVVG